MRKIIILILFIWPNFSVADQGIEIICVNMKSALFGRKYKPLEFKLEATAFQYFDIRSNSWKLDKLVPSVLEANKLCKEFSHKKL